MKVGPIIIIIIELQSWKGPYGSSSPTPVKEAQWGIKLTTLGSATRDLNHRAIQQFVYIFWKTEIKI